MTEQEILDEAIKRYGQAPNWKQDGTTFIYFLQGEQGGPIKIGHARDPLSRRDILQCGNPLRLVLRHAEVSLPIEERRLHVLFGDFRMQGEWFIPHPVVASIARAIPDESLAELPVNAGMDHMPNYACWTEWMFWSHPTNSHRPPTAEERFADYMQEQHGVRV